MSEPKDLRALFRPASIAIVGCSPVASGKLGSWPLRNLLLQDAPVAIHPVNPKHDEIDGLACVPSLEDLAAAPDLVLVLVPAAHALDEVRRAERVGARAAIVFGSGFGETPAGVELERELAAFARSSALPICGPNTDGVVNVIDGIPCGFPPYAAITPRPVGDVAIVSQSGALVSSLVQRLIRNGSGLTYSCAIGNAIDIGLADYVDHLATDERTATILAYAEGVPDSERFVAAAGRAIEAGKTVAILKGGRSAAGGAAARSHTGSLVGSHDAFVALCRAHGVVVVDRYEELAAIPRLAPVARRLRGPTARNVAVITGSGAVGVNLADEASAHGFAVAPFGDSTVARLAGRLQFAAPQNPLDLTGQVVHDATLHADVLEAVAADPEVGLVVSGQLYGPAEITDRLKHDLEQLAVRPVVVYSADGSEAVDEPVLATVPVLPSAAVLFGCLAGLLDSRDARELRGDRVSAPTTARAATGPRDAAWAWSFLERAGVPTAARVRVATAAEASAAAAGILAAGGRAIAVKADSEAIAHKTELGLVELGLASPAEAAAAFSRVAAALTAAGHPDAPVIVQELVPHGVEVLLAARHEPGMGPFVVLAAGGLYTEALADSLMVPSPVHEREVVAMIGRLRVGRLLHGERRSSPLALDALVDTVVRFAQATAALGPELGEIEINPLIVTERAAVAVDVLAIDPPEPKEKVG